MVRWSLNRTSVGLKPEEGLARLREGAGPQSNQRGIETRPPRDGPGGLPGLNRTSVGLKLDLLPKPLRADARLNRTSVGLKPLLD